MLAAGRVLLTRDTTPEVRDAIGEILSSTSMEHLDTALSRYKALLERLTAEDKKRRAPKGGARLGVVTDADMEASVDMFAKARADALARKGTP